MKASLLFAIGFLLLMAGFGILVVGSATTSSGSVGGVVFIGPIPIVFGSGPSSGILVVASLLIAGLMIVMFYVSFLRVKRQKKENPVIHKY